MSIKIDQTAHGVIFPKTEDGKSAKVSNISWAVEGSATIAASPDGLSAVLTPTAPGPVTVTVSAVNAANETLTESVSDIITDLIAKTLGLTLQPTSF